MQRSLVADVVYTVVYLFWITHLWVHYAKENDSHLIFWLKNVKQTLIDPKNTFTKILGTSQAFNQ